MNPKIQLEGQSMAQELRTMLRKYNLRLDGFLVYENVSGYLSIIHFGSTKWELIKINLKALWVIIRKR